MPIRELLAVVLGALLGLALLLAPRAALQLSVVVGPTRRRRGEYGGEPQIPDWWVLAVRGLGLAILGVAGFIAFQTFL
jgi:hypothetical protein